MAKKDTGIAILPNGVRISESVRDALLKRAQGGRLGGEGATETVITTKDLQDTEFSGFRLNEFSNDVELWVLGRVAAKRKAGDVQRNPALMMEMHEEVFATNGSMLLTKE